MLGSVNLINSTLADDENIEIPNGWSIMTVLSFCMSVKSGSTPSRTDNSYWSNGTIPWLKSGEVHNNITIYTEECITQDGLENSSTNILPPDTVLMAMYGVTAGQVGYLAISATTNQAICGMICKSKAQAAFLYFTLIHNQPSISRLSNGGAQDNLSKAFIENLKLLVPPKQSIASAGFAPLIEQLTLNTREILIMEQLQQTLLSQLSSGK